MLDKIVGNLTVLARLPGQLRVPYLPEERRIELRDARVRETVRYAAETVPYYRELFRAEGIDPSDIKTAADLERLPLLDKETVQADPDRFISESRLGRTSVPFLTSGSTGMRLRIHHDRRSLLQNLAYSERHRIVEASLCGKRFRYRKVSIGGPRGTGPRVQSFYRQKTFIPLRPRRRSISTTEPIERIVAMINEFRPLAIWGFGTYLDMFFKALVKRGDKLHLPRVVTYGSDMMTREGKQLIEEHFGVPLLSHYNAVEAFQIAFLCEERRHFHLHDDLTHLTIVDPDGRNAPTGAEGEVVVSNLVNRGSVLLNYRLGDRATLLDGGCSCGRTLPLLSQLEGRVEDILTLPDGNFLPGGRIWSVIRRRPEILRYQFVQVEPLRYELKLMTATRHEYDSIVEDMLRDLGAIVGPSATVEASYHSALEPGPGGKFQAFVNLCK
jgi:phenylacetate-coenzyme A ligase PaaK-like adenylate-forming protein